ncbi:MAG: M23 family metallopeptidase [Candidatus Hydrogenedentes bacterium]|nr:M23 family metallopeptidase [Candidatus Hydrogenedentota bacterium]
MSLLSIAYSVLTVSAMSAQLDGVSVQCLTKDKKVIPLYSQCGQFWTTNVKLPDVLVINRNSDVVTVNEVEITGLAEGREVAMNRIAADLPAFIRQVNEQFKKKLGKGVLNEVYEPRMATQFGSMVFANTTLSESEAVGCGESAVIVLSNGVYFSFTGLAKVDDIRVKVVVAQGAETRSIQCPIVFTPYQSKGDYVFPLKGDLCAVNLPMNIAQHRAALSQEFAIDVIAAGPIEDGKPPGIGRPSLARLSDYPIFHREVMAVGSGVVVETGDRFPESLMGDPSAYSRERFEELTAELAPKIGFLSCVVGNYVVIDHENGEFSCYAHLSEGSIRVKLGDRVGKGDVIGAVGNTGHSTEPHLHFQLMDSKDFLKANGLPIMFSNVPPSAINQNCKAANSLSATDYVNLRLNK